MPVVDLPEKPQRAGLAGFSVPRAIANNDLACSLNF